MGLEQAYNYRGLSDSAATAGRVEPANYRVSAFYSRYALARRDVRRNLRGQGIGVHSEQEVHAIGIRDLCAVADYLGDKPFLMGDSATTIDAAAYGLLANILLAPIVSPIKDEGLKRANLVAYLDRMRDSYYAEN